ncbi:MAG: type II toxin-antitoxin system RelE/ParE family toxin [Chitinophagaceae bacterium]|nr:type II toxin-antitoxin system RelE/ParE family toxin [Chitinophagaceae bacterium]
MDKQKKAVAKTYQIRLSVNAVQNIDEITGYITFIKQQPLNAIRVGDAIFKTISKISERPYAFKECEAIPTSSKMYRQASCFNWLVIYKIENSFIIVLGVIHASRKPSKIKALKKIK